MLFGSISKCVSVGRFAKEEEFIHTAKHVIIT